MGKFVKRGKKKEVKKNRKELRKDQRKQKKQRKQDYYVNRKKPGKFVLINNNDNAETVKKVDKKQIKRITKPKEKVDKRIEEIKNEQEKERKLQIEMQMQRKIQLKEANKDEDKVIKHLAKQLKLNKRKSKSMPKSFTEDGLDYLLEMCDPENVKSLVAAEEQFASINNEFDEDFALMTEGKTSKNDKKKSKCKEINEQIDNESVGSNIDEFDEEISGESGDSVKSHEDELLNSSMDDESNDEFENEYSDLESEENDNSSKNNNKKVKLNEDMKDEKNKDSSDSDDETHKDTWEDIYGRKRRKDGTVIEQSAVKYIPPALRETMDETDKKRSEKLQRLTKQLKGLLNRLAESNMHSICTQIEELYMSNSRNDMNETITRLIFDSLISHVFTPERLLLEHVMLMTILHANIGTEVGAHFLQNIVKKFDELYNQDLPVENKELDNTVCTIAQLYNFKMFHSQLLYQILSKLSDKFEEKHVECILLILKNVGFTLRKDDALALKQLILDLQKKATTVSDDNSRVTFMLDILLAIKNNNMSKIPNYDTSYAEHLKKLLKGFIRKGNYVTQLNISLDDLLKAEERGRWWVVGSAWTGTEEPKKEGKSSEIQQPEFQKKLLELARKQHMNTDTRRNVFCIIMSAEDYLDAFEKLLHLGLKNQQDREIIHVIFHCCLQEKKFNPYYGVLAQKFCEYDRKYQMTIRCSVWDKLKALTTCSGQQISNLARLLTHLFINQGLPLSTLKVVQFSELDKTTLRFIRQVLLGLLLHEDEESCVSVFQKVSSPKLKMFRESLRLFIHHFLLRNINTGSVSEDQRRLLETRVQLVEKHLSVSDSKLQF